MSFTYGDYFSGAGIATAGFKGAGLIPVFGVECDPHPKRLKTSMAIADMYEANFGKHIKRVPVQEIDPADLPRVFWFHASPVCKNASVANAAGGEDDTDVVTAQAVIDYFTHHLPNVVTIENVYGYRHFQAYKNIIYALHSCGYGFREDKINMADYGVPQVRERLIVTAVHNTPAPSLVPPTHEKEPRASIFGTMPRWVSWYEAIEDLIPSLPTAYHSSRKRPCEHDPDGKPCRQSPYCRGQNAPWQQKRLPEEFNRNFLMHGTTASPMNSMSAPSSVIVSYPKTKAFIDPGGNASSFSVRYSDEPARVVGDVERVGNGSNDPAFTMTAAQHKGNHISVANGRIVKITPHAAARFQSLPDWYQLSGKASVDFPAVGNGVPSLFCEKQGRHILKDFI